MFHSTTNTNTDISTTTLNCNMCTFPHYYFPSSFSSSPPKPNNKNNDNYLPQPQPPLLQPQIVFNNHPYDPTLLSDSQQVHFGSNSNNFNMIKQQQDQHLAMCLLAQPMSNKAKNKKKKLTDRHSKICTAQGMRDRRVRLSVDIAREFFDLHDMLGFDKASKTLEWLLQKSKNAIHELYNSRATDNDSNNNDKLIVSGSSSKSFNSSSNSNYEVVEVSREFGQTLEVSQANKLVDEPSGLSNVTKELRANARARARARTNEKKKLKCCSSNSHTCTKEIQKCGSSFDPILTRQFRLFSTLNYSNNNNNKQFPNNWVCSTSNNYACDDQLQELRTMSIIDQETDNSNNVMVYSSSSCSSLLPQSWEFNNSMVSSQPSFFHTDVKHYL